MFDVKISGLPSSTGVTPASDYIPIVHNGTTEKITPDELINGTGLATTAQLALKADTTTVNAALALKTNITDLAASTGATLVKTIQSGTGAVARTVDAKLKETVSVKDFGAVGDGVTDDTAAIQAAIDANGGKVILFPFGKYKTSSTINITIAGTVLSGESNGGGGSGYDTGSTIINTGSSDAIFFYSSVGVIHGCGIKDISVIRKTTILTGAAIHIKHCNTFNLDNCFVSEHYVGYLLEGVANSRFSNINAYTGTKFTGATNSCHLKVLPLPTYVFPNFADAGWINTFTNITFTSDFKTEHGIFVGSGDSNLFSSGYIGGSDVANIYIKIQLEAPLNSTHFNNLYLDGVSWDPLIQTTYGAYIANDATSAKVLDVEFNNCTIGQPGTGILVTEVSLPNLVVSGCSIFNTSGSGIAILGSDVSGAITGNSFWNCGRLTDTSSAVYVGYAKSLAISGNNFNECNGATNIYGIRLDSTATIDNVAITGNSFNLVDIDFYNAATISNYSLSGNSSANVTSTVLGSYLGNVANSSVDRLDYYLEGTFSPSVTFGGLAVGLTISTRTATFTRIGNKVLYSIYILLSAKGSSTGTAVVTGLPVWASTIYPSAQSIRVSNMTAGVGDTHISALVDTNTTIGLYKQSTGTGNITGLTELDFTNNSNLFISGNYTVA